MNAIALIILAAMLGEYLLQVIAELLNIGTFTKPLPEEFRGVYDPGAYAKSQDYTKSRITFGLWSSTWQLVSSIGFWFAGGFNALDIIVRQWQLGSILTGLCYIGILVFARSLLSLPFSVYSTFVIEERFGFNTTTVKTYILDLLKGFILAVLLGAPLLAGVLWFFENAGPLAWFYCWSAAVVFSLILQYVAPTWIMPLFNKFTPLPDGELKERILAFADSVRFSLRDVFMIDGSKRSSKSNAFFTGFGKNKRIALFDTLVRQHTIPELVAVLAHEIGHYKKWHILQGIFISIFHTGLIFYLLSLVLTRSELFGAFFMTHISLYAGLIFCGMLFIPLEFIISLFMHVLSRRNEFAADRFAAETTNDAKSMISALKKLSLNNLSHLTPHPLYVVLNYSHPPVLERIRALGG